MLKSANREVLPRSGEVSWQRLDRRLEHGIPFNWHHHPEIELTLTLNCTGQRFVGDNVSGFGDGDLALVGSNLPHTWVSQERIDPSKPYSAKVIWFDRDWLNTMGHSAPELSSLVPFCDRAQRGLQFTPSTRTDARPLIDRLFEVPQAEGITTLLELLSGIVPRRGRGIALSSTGGIAKDRCVFRADEPRFESRPPEL